MSESQPYQVMPEMDEQAFERLKEDIKQHGVEYPIIINADGEVIDGHHRKRAWQELGRDVDDLPTRIIDASDTENYHRAYRTNLLQRDLTDGTKRQVVKQYLLEHPERVDDDTQEAIASDLGVAQKTVSNAVSELRDGGKLSKVTKLPTDEKKRRVRDYVDENPDASNRDVADVVDFDITYRTVGNWRNEWDEDTDDATGLDTFTTSAKEKEATLDVASKAKSDDDEVAEVAEQEAEEISSGKSATDAAKDVDKGIKKAEDEKRREEQRDNFVDAVESKNAVTVRNGSLENLLPEFDGEIDHIVTDPPYDESALETWDNLGRIAAEVLPEGGLLAAYTGQYYLDEVMDALGEHLEYFWQFIVTHEQPNYFIKYDIGIKYKPIVVFGKPPVGRPERQAHDVLDAGAREKENHDWEQPVAEAATLIEALSEPNDVICDPMCGSGTTGVAALQTDRQTILLDEDGSAIETTTERVGGVIEND